MASNEALIMELLKLKADDVGGIQLYASYVKRKEPKTLHRRLLSLVEFMRWASNRRGFEWEGASVTAYRMHLVRTRQLAKSTVSTKLAHVRAFLLAGEQEGIIDKCVYYAKRGPAPKKMRTELAIFEKATEQEKRRAKREKAKADAIARETIAATSRQIAKQALYRLFGLPEIFSETQLKKAFRHVASAYHPDVNKDKKANEYFLLYRDAFDVLSDVVSRTKYDFYVHGKMASPDITSLVKRANSFMRTSAFKRVFV